MVEKLGYGFLYHYNSYTQEYLCFSRDALEQVFNGYPPSKYGQTPNYFIARSKESFEDAAQIMLKHREKYDTTRA